MEHETAETLSALIDDELAPSEAARAKVHVAECSECARLLNRLESASTAFQDSGSHEMPLGLATRVKALAAGDAKSRTLNFRLAAAFVLVLIVLSGLGLRTLSPRLFSNIQQMITGAASSMGAGGK